MASHIFPTIAFFILALRPYLAIAASTSTAGAVTISNTPGYISQRDCVQQCLYSGRNAGGFPENIVAWLGCLNNLDTCFCRADLASSASSLLTSGINSACSSNPGDVAGGISVYNSYCSRDTAATTTGANSVTVAAATVTATETVASSTASILTPFLSTPTSIASTFLTSPSSKSISPSTSSYGAPSPTSSASSAGGDGGLSTSDKIGISFSLGLGLPATAAAIVTVILQVRKRNNRREENQE